MDGIRVLVGECRCFGKPHDQDWVDLAPEATIDIGAAAHAAVANYGDDMVAFQVALGRAYIHYGIKAWSFRNEIGPIPITPTDRGWGQVIDYWVPFARGGYDLAEKADELYSGTVLTPLVQKMASSSKDGQTASSTSPTRLIGSARQKRSGLSSPVEMVGLPSEGLAR